MDHHTEASAAVPEANWESLICAEPEDSNEMMQFLDFSSFNSLDPSVYCPEHDSSSSSYRYCSTDGSNSYSECYYLDESNSAVLGSNAGFIPMEQQLLLDKTSNGSTESNLNTDHHMSFLTERRVDFDESFGLEQSPLKKARADTNKGKRKKQHPKEKQRSKKRSESEGGRRNIMNNSSEDESCESEGNSGSRSKGSKLRAERGSATDPQSLYARKRRERINERLKILQNLVPNGTKVDISTMLEEAVEYVKFLQLQFKLLSSDELWMYAPIACNGMNIGLDLKIFQQL